MEFSSVVKQWKKSDDKITDIVGNIAIELGCVIANLVMAINCEVVIFGGEYHVFSSQILPIIQRIIDKKAIKPVKILPSTLKEKANSTGMATLCRTRFFDTISEI